MNEHYSLQQRYVALVQRYPPHVLEVAGARWEVIEVGSGPPLLLLPGGFGIAATSFEYIAAFAHDYHVIAPTFPPHTRRVADLADGVAAVLAGLTDQPVYVLGGSAGGVVAQVLVRRHPSYVAGVILAQTRAPQPARVRQSQQIDRLCRQLPVGLTLALLRMAMFAFLPQRNALHAFWRRHFAEVIGRQDRAALAARFAVLADYDANYTFTPADLRDWPGWIAILAAGSDRMVPAAQQRALQHFYPQAQVYTVDGAGHSDSVTAAQAQITLIRRIFAAAR